jgi:hypothetical protein
VSRDRIPVTDHAVLRYLERICGVDVLAVRRKIHALAITGIAKGARGGKRDGIVYRLRGGEVATVFAADPLMVRQQHAHAVKKIMRKARAVPVRVEAAE